MKLFIMPDGTIKTLYGEDFDLGAVGYVKDVRRASNVEPGPGGWYADMALSGGGTLGPFKARSEAIAAEVAWLERKYGEYRP